MDTLKGALPREQFQLKRFDLLYILIGLAVFLNLSGLFDTLMDVDATRYAVVAKTMVVRNNYLEMFCDGTDWLDKPHFPFWVTAFFFRLFGFHSWSYKLPGILFLLLGAFYTYKLAKDLYNKEIALVSVLILLTAQHIILSNNDVRAEPFLTGLITGGIYHFYKTIKTVRFGHILLGALFTGCAIMTKGIFALIPVGGAIATELAFKKDWKNLFHWKWLLAGVLILVFILPELYALYIQFDSHPEKVVFGKTNVSGVRFFFWDSQFGRFLNSGPIKGEGDPFFFVHTLLWAFLPWSILLYTGIFITFRNQIKHRWQQEWLCLGGSLLTFLLFSASRFQLPHYMNIVFPLFSIITARFLFQLSLNKLYKTLWIIQLVLIFLFLFAPLLIQVIFKPFTDLIPSFIIIAALLAAFIFVWLRIKERNYRLLALSVIASGILNVYLNQVFYPSLLKYQSGSEAGFWLNSHNSANLPVASTRFTYSLEFYLNQPLHYTDTSGKLNTASYFLYVPENKVSSLNLPGKRLSLVRRFMDYPITRMDIGFFNSRTRQSNLRYFDLFLIQ